MAVIKAFKGYRPAEGLAEKVASRPYDVLNSEEARAEAAGNPYSFYHVNKPEIDLDPSVDLYSDEVYEKGRENLQRMISEGTLIQDPEACMYVYRQVMGSQEQTGLVACSAIDDYFNDVIKKHELTRASKEADRIRHMATLSAHVGPVFLTYPDHAEIDGIIAGVCNGQPTYDFTADDGVRHIFWVVDEPSLTSRLESLFASDVPVTYIADGHHRAASSAKVGQELREIGSYDGSEDFNYFLSVLFPAGQLKIIDYNRVVTDLNSHSQEDFLKAIAERMDIEAVEGECRPAAAHEFGMYMDGKWYRLRAREGSFDANDPVDVLDVSILTNQVLQPILGIEDQRRDNRIDFVGGIRGLGELEKRVNSGEMAVAFALYPVSIQQLMDIADSGEIMPPKSTWFEPKLRSGLVIHTF